MPLSLSRQRVRNDHPAQMRLMKMPHEILSLIFAELGPSELRKDVNYLLVSRQWYSLAQPIFLSALNVTTVKLSAVSLARFPPTSKESPLFSLIQQSAERLSLRLLGHWWDKNTSRDCENYHDSWDEIRRHLSGKDDEYENDNVPEADFTAADDNADMDVWRKRINTSIHDLAFSLSGFRSLQTLRLEFSAEDDDKIGPFWNYLYDSSISAFFVNLPIQHHLTDLTLDICGVNYLIPPCGERRGISPAHICPLIAQLLPHLVKARLRLPCMCPAIFPDNTKPDTAKLECLILKLHQPFWERRGPGLHPNSKSHGENYCTLPCPPATVSKAKATTTMPEDLHESIYRAARRARSSMPGLNMFRISYSGCKDDGIVILGIDVLTTHTIYLPEEFFIYEDDGTPCWWEECDNRIATGGTFTT